MRLKTQKNHAKTIAQKKHTSCWVDHIIFQIRMQKMAAQQTLLAQGRHLLVDDADLLSIKVNGNNMIYQSYHIVWQNFLDVWCDHGLIPSEQCHQLITC